MKQCLVVIIGGSIAGYLTALQLRKNSFVTDIVIIEQDTYPEKAGFRKYVPHSPHVHQINFHALNQIRQLAPQFDQEFTAVGLPDLHWGGSNVGVLTQWGMLDRNSPLGFTTKIGSRVLVEQILREEVLRIGEQKGDPDCRIVMGKCTGVVYNHLTNTVVGVTYLKDNSNVVQINADYTIVCTGNNNEWAKWMADVEKPIPQQLIDANLTYWSADFEGIDPQFDLVGAGDTLEHSVAGVVTPVEGRVDPQTGIRIPRHRVTVYSYYDRSRVIETQEDLVTFATYIDTRFGDVFKKATMVSKVSRYTACYNRLYEIWKTDFPIGLAIVGDALMKTDPKYGFGIDLCVEQAALVDTMIGEMLTPEEYTKALKASVSSVWNLVTLQDIRHMRHHKDPKAPRLTPSQRGQVFFMNRIEKISNAQIQQQLLTTFLKIAHKQATMKDLWTRKVILALLKTFVPFA